METVEVKVRPVGNALGLILPGKLVREEKIRSGESVMLTVFKRRKVSIDSLLGLAKGAKPFQREHGGRN
ncbi:MAG: hypothetical protein ABIG96_00655 [Candidatus Micrarchaeota archaeon]